MTTEILERFNLAAIFVDAAASKQHAGHMHFYAGVPAHALIFKLHNIVLVLMTAGYAGVS